VISVAKVSGFYFNEKNLSFLQEGDILLMRPVSKYMMLKYPVAWMILTFTKSTWTHAAVYNGDNLLLESTGQGVAINNPLITNHYANYKFIAFRFKDQPTQRLFLKHAREKVGRSYDFIQAFIIALYDLIYDKLGWSSIKQTNKDFDTDDRYFCSEVVSDSLYEAGIDIRKDVGIDRSQMLPDDVLKLESLFFDRVLIQK